MKKRLLTILIVLLCVVALISFVSCDPSSSNSGKPGTEEKEPGTGGSGTGDEGKEPGTGGHGTVGDEYQYREVEVSNIISQDIPSITCSDNMLGLFEFNPSSYLNFEDVKYFKNVEPLFLLFKESNSLDLVRFFRVRDDDNETLSVSISSETGSFSIEDVEGKQIIKIYSGSITSPILQGEFSLEKEEGDYSEEEIKIIIKMENSNGEEDTIKMTKICDGQSIELGSSSNIHGIWGSYRDKGNYIDTTYSQILESKMYECTVQQEKEGYLLRTMGYGSPYEFVEDGIAKNDNDYEQAILLVDGKYLVFSKDYCYVKLSDSTSPLFDLSTSPLNNFNYDIPSEPKSASIPGTYKMGLSFPEGDEGRISGQYIVDLQDDGKVIVDYKGELVEGSWEQSNGKFSLNLPNSDVRIENKEDNRSDQEITKISDNHITPINSDEIEGLYYKEDNVIKILCEIKNGLVRAQIGYGSAGSIEMIQEAFSSYMIKDNVLVIGDTYMALYKVGNLFFGNMTKIK